MTGSLQVKRGYLYIVITYKYEVGKVKHKWISTRLKECGNKREAKALMDKELDAFEEAQALLKERLNRRGKPKTITRIARIGAILL